MGSNENTENNPKETEEVSFKEKIKKRIGLLPEETKPPKTPKQKALEFFKSLAYAGVAALIIITFVIQNTRIPTGSMESTILVGDFVLVNKFVFGSSSPKYIPFTNVQIPYFRLPALREPKAKDIVVFEYPGDKDTLYPEDRGINYVKRCIGTPGDTIQIIDKVVFVNGKEFWIPPNIQYEKENAIPRDLVNPRIFPKNMPWNEDNYGPLVVPKKGSSITLNTKNVEQWKIIIDREYGRSVVDVKGDQVTIEGKPVTGYTFKKDYFFMMGDNRDNSLDSRFWGFVARDMVVGEAFITLLSWDREIPFTDFIKLIASIRPERILKLLH